jgi:hypothetical protein
MEAARPMIVVLINLPCLRGRLYCATLCHYYAARAPSLVMARSTRRRWPAATVLDRVRMRCAKALPSVLSPALASLDSAASTFLKWLRGDLLLPDHHVVALQAEGHQRRRHRPFSFSELDACGSCAALVIAHAKLLLLGATRHFVLLIQDPVID